MPMAEADGHRLPDGLRQAAKSSLYKLCQAGKVPGTKIGRTWRFHKDVIDTWIKTGVPPTQAYGKTRAKAKKRKKA
jgi:excisionase family DNA binding protein